MALEKMRAVLPQRRPLETLREAIPAHEALVSCVRSGLPGQARTALQKGLVALP